MCNFDKNKDYEYDFKTDIWSLGVSFYELCYEKIPFDSKNRNDLFD